MSAQSFHLSKVYRYVLACYEISPTSHHCGMQRSGQSSKLWSSSLSGFAVCIISGPDTHRPPLGWTYIGHWIDKGEMSHDIKLHANIMMRRQYHYAHAVSCSALPRALLSGSATSLSSGEDEMSALQWH